MNLETLRQIHHCHLLNIPYENLDVQLDHPLDFDIERIFGKLVEERRGGWCYEMNGLLGWALQEIGFNVTRMAGGVMREQRGDSQMGNHLILGIDLPGRRYLADTGLGDGIRYPIPIAADTYTQQDLSYELRRLDGDMWRLSNHEFSNIRSFDFLNAPADEGLLAEQCHWLQTDPQSPFRQVMIVQRFSSRSIDVQLGKIHTRITARGRQSRVIETQEALQQQLADTFGLTVDIHRIWPQIESAHQRLFQGHGSDASF